MKPVTHHSPRVACKQLYAHVRTNNTILLLLFHVTDDSTVNGLCELLLVAGGAVCHAVDAVVSGKSRNAFCAVRPPGTRVHVLMCARVGVGDMS